MAFYDNIGEFGNPQELGTLKKDLPTPRKSLGGTALDYYTGVDKALKGMTPEQSMTGANVFFKLAEAINPESPMGRMGGVASEFATQNLQGKKNTAFNLMLQDVMSGKELPEGAFRDITPEQSVMLSNISSQMEGLGLEKERTEIASTEAEANKIYREQQLELTKQRIETERKANKLQEAILTQRTKEGRDANIRALGGWLATEYPQLAKTEALAVAGELPTPNAKPEEWEAWRSRYDLKYEEVMQEGVNKYNTFANMLGIPTIKEAPKPELEGFGGGEEINGEETKGKGFASNFIGSAFQPEENPVGYLMGSPGGLSYSPKANGINEFFDTANTTDLNTQNTLNDYTKKYQTYTTPELMSERTMIEDTLKGESSDTTEADKTYYNKLRKRLEIINAELSKKGES